MSGKQAYIIEERSCVQKTMQNALGAAMMCSGCCGTMSVDKERGVYSLHVKPDACRLEVALRVRSQEAPLVERRWTCARASGLSQARSLRRGPAGDESVRLSRAPSSMPSVCTKPAEALEYEGTQVGAEVEERKPGAPAKVRKFTQFERDDHYNRGTTNERDYATEGRAAQEQRGQLGRSARAWPRLLRLG